MAIDSKVAFQNRALELGIDQLEIDALDAAGINSYATYAYCSTYQPGQNDDTALIGFPDYYVRECTISCFDHTLQTLVFRGACLVSGGPQISCRQIRVKRGKDNTTS